MFQFMSNQISLGKPKTFDDILSEKRQKQAEAEQKAIKTASAKNQKVQKKAEFEEELLEEEPMNESVEEIDIEETPEATSVEEAEIPVEDISDEESEDILAQEADTDINAFASSGKFVKIAKLNDKTKNWLREYWKNLYPAEYVDMMLKD
jgi:hypothetical protein